MNKLKSYLTKLLVIFMALTPRKCICTNKEESKKTRKIERAALGVAIIVGLAGIVFGIWNGIMTREQLEGMRKNIEMNEESNYLQYRSYLSLKSIQFSNSSKDEVEFTIENNGLTTAKDIVMDLGVRTNYNGIPGNDKGLIYNLTTGQSTSTTYNAKKIEYTLIGFIGDIGKHGSRNIKAKFKLLEIQKEYQSIINGTGVMLLEIVYRDYKDIDYEHHYVLGYTLKDNKFYIKDDYEKKVDYKKGRLVDLSKIPQIGGQY